MLNKQYLDYLSSILDCCYNQTVLEIGPLSGDISKVILEKNPKQLTLVEPNAHCVELLREDSQIVSNCSIINRDINFYLLEPRLADVVICLGVLYHLHSPLHLLELIVNNAQPDTLVLDIPEISMIEFDHCNTTMYAKGGIEIDNIVGNRQLPTNWLSAGLYIIPNQLILDTAMINMGYKIVHQDADMRRFGELTKKEFTTTVYKKSGV